MNHTDYIDYAIKIAKAGQRFVSPNPMVGALIVHNNQIISEGWHQYYGKEHAERIAIQNLNEHSKKLLHDCTMYVTLEPCNHFGKTPPCTELIIDSGIKKLVFGNYDPNTLMYGKSISFLKSKGVECIGPISENKCKALIVSFETNIIKKRPFIILKWAQSSDFYLGTKDERIKISSWQSDILVHKWRAESDAIISTTNTFLVDNPQFNIRHWSGTNPKKIILTTSKEKKDTFSKIHTDIVFLRTRTNELLKTFIELYEDFQIGTVIIEAGPTFLQELILENLWDEARIITNRSVKLCNGLKAPLLEGQKIKEYTLGTDNICIVSNTDSKKR
ncbi:MAG: bifunctional diaminohydroxyphosphoribosylaminopyrimidine deaminase/5-amino-6-(5-phosphoribosylamino)uracil reductase RibD [Saprospiraceae bacterium]|nr:bifunctional diaminohydroxyphosphoribosylaminopyrimidine deaminase/5-amino-6-(5-phosphoribosylamino)uracil reductase RibD [Saprospiraceae bacterium]